jgi:hypothetical protein
MRAHQVQNYTGCAVELMGLQKGSLISCVFFCGRRFSGLAFIFLVLFQPSFFSARNELRGRWSENNNERVVPGKLHTAASFCRAHGHVTHERRESLSVVPIPSKSTVLGVRLGVEFTQNVFFLYEGLVNI